MVVLDYHGMDTVFQEVKQAACGRQACSVMIIVANEVDAMASAKILTHLLRSENVAYKLRPVANFTHILDIVDEFTASDIKTVFMVNCGAIYNIPKLFRLEQGGDYRVIIMDNHRPFHLANVHSAYSVALIDDSSGLTDTTPSDGDDLSSGIESSEEESDDDDEDDNDVPLDDDLSDDEGTDVEEDDELGELGEEEGDGEAEEENNDVEVEQSDHDGDDEAGDEEENSDGEEQAELEEELQHEEEEAENDGASSAAGENTEENTEEVNAEPVDDQDPGNDDPDNDEEEEVILRRKRKLLSEKYDPAKARRKRLRDYYSRASFISAPTSVMLLLLCRSLNKARTNDIMWLAILGATALYQSYDIPEGLYNAICDELQSDLSDEGGAKYRLALENGEELLVPGSEKGNIISCNDYRFFLYRFWSLYDAMYYSSYMSSKLVVYKTAGHNKLQELLARMGIPLTQSKQTYMYMSPPLRQQLRQQLTGPIAEEFQLTDPGVLMKSFCRYNSFRNAVSASDLVLATQALIDSADADSDEWMQHFNVAYDALGLKANSEEGIAHGIDMAIALQKAIVGQATSMIESHKAIVNLKPFRYAIIPAPVATHESVFTKPSVLLKLAHFVVDIQRENGQWVGKRAKPLLLAAEKRNSYILLGVDVRKRSATEVATSGVNFRHIFKFAAEESNAKFRNDAFNTSLVEVAKEDVMPLIENIFFLMNGLKN